MDYIYLSINGIPQSLSSTLPRISLGHIGYLAAVTISFRVIVNTILSSKTITN